MRRLFLLLLVACQSAPSASTPTLVEDFELPNGTLAMLLQGTPRTQFGDLVSTPALRNFKKRWALVVKHRGSKAIVAETLVADLPGDTLEKPWHRRSGDRLWVWDTEQLLLFDLATAKLLYKQAELPAQQAAFTPPFALHERKTDRSGALVVRDQKGRWFRVDAALKATATEEATIEEEWRAIEYEELHGCATKTRYGFRGDSDRKGIVDLTHVKHHGKDVVDETFLSPQLFVDRTRHCVLDGSSGPLVFSLDNLSAGAPVLLAHVDGKNSKHVWQLSLSERCGQGMPAFARQTAEHVTLVFAGGGVCRIALSDGAVTWRKSAQELVPGATKMNSVRGDGDATALWLAKTATEAERVTIGADGAVLDRLSY